MNLLDNLKNVSRSTLNIIYPNQCCLCAADLNTAENYICLSCSYDLPYLEYTGDEKQKLQKLFWGRIEIEEVYSLFNYQKGNQISTLLQEIKYKGKTKLAQHLGSQLSEHINMNEIDFVIPLPLHPKKQRLRGYNQSTAIADGIASTSTVKVREDLIIRRAHNLSQTLFSKYDRWENVRSIFELKKPKLIHGKHLLVVDDVLTTGATLEACAAELKNNSDCQVSVATLAVRL